MIVGTSRLLLDFIPLLPRATMMKNNMMIVFLKKAVAVSYNNRKGPTSLSFGLGATCRNFVRILDSTLTHMESVGDANDQYWQVHNIVLNLLSIGK